MVATAVCSECFSNYGLRIEARKIGLQDGRLCSTCNLDTGAKLNSDNLHGLAYDFFVGGSILRATFGAFNLIEFNDYHYGKDAGCFSPELSKDAALIGEALKIGFFLASPAAWKWGEIYPLKKLNHRIHRKQVIQEILMAYPTVELTENDTFFRLRTNVELSNEKREYDAAPKGKSRARFNQDGSSILYGSQDLEICFHECRVTIADDIYVARLRPTQPLRLLDLTHDGPDNETPFDSLDLAIKFLFAAGSASYAAATAIAKAARIAGYQGIVFPSYFNRVKVGAIANLGIFGRPIRNGLITVDGINRLHLEEVTYRASFRAAI